MDGGQSGGVSAASPLLSCGRHALPLFTSLLNTVCAYDPVGYGIPYNHLLFSDYREPLAEEAVQVLIVTLDHDHTTSASPTVDGTTTGTAMDDADVRMGGALLGSGQVAPPEQSWAWGTWWAPGGESGTLGGQGGAAAASIWAWGGGRGRGAHSPQLHPWQPPGPENLFVNYLSRIHREEVSQALLSLWWALPAHRTAMTALQGGGGGRRDRAAGVLNPT